MRVFGMTDIGGKGGEGDGLSKPTIHLVGI